MNKPSLCYRCHKLIGTATICPYCFTDQTKSTTRLAITLRIKSRSWLQQLWQTSFTNKVLSITVGMFVIQLLMTLVLSPSAFFTAIFRGPPINILLALGASSPFVFTGHWWAPFTAIFLHGGILHLGFNMMALTFISHTIERTTSPWYFVLTYLVSGALGFILSATFGNYSVGASGALFGLIGCGMVLAFISGSGRHDPLFVLLLNWAIMGLLFGAVIPGIDNSAHLGGLAAGAGCGWAWSRYNHLKIFRKLSMWGGFILAILTIIGWITSVSTLLPIALR